MKALRIFCGFCLFPLFSVAQSVVSFSPGPTFPRLEEGMQNQSATIRVLRTGDISSAVQIPIVPTQTITHDAIATLSMPALEFRLEPLGPWTALHWIGQITLAFPAGATEASFEIRAHDNNAYEMPQQYGGRLEFGALPPSVSLFFPDQIGYSITDNDPLPSATVTPANLIEGTGGTPATTQVQVTLDRPLGFAGMNGLAVPRFTLEGTGANPAVEGVDYRLPSGNIATGLVPYGTTFSFPVEILPNSTWQGNRTFRLKSINPAPFEIEIPGASTITIEDDEEQEEIPFPGLTILPASGVEPSSFSAWIGFTVTLNAARAEPTTFYVRTRDGTAVTPADFRLEQISEVRTIAAGELSVGFSVRLTRDFIAEEDETFEVVLSSSAGGPAIATAIGTIIDDDRYFPLVSNASVLEGNSGTSVLRYTIAIQAPAVRDILLSYSAAGGTANTGDFVAASGTAIIPSGMTSATVEVTVNGDTLIEADETVILTITSTDPLVVSGTYTGTGTILHDDYGAPPVPAATLVTESTGGPEVLAWFQVSIASQPFPVSCQVSTRDDSATGAGGDYRPLNASIAFSAGETSKWVAVAVTPDTSEEGKEQFFLDVRHSDTGDLRSAACTVDRLNISRFWQVAPSLFAIRFPSGLGQRYIVYEAPSVKGPWIPSSSLLTGTGFPVTQTIFAESGQGFFRVQTAPPLPPGTAAAGP